MPRQLLITRLRNANHQLSGHLALVREEGRLLYERQDWFWWGLVESMATYGGAVGVERLRAPENGNHRDSLSYNNLVALPENDRAGVIRDAFRVINPRYLSRKVRTLTEALQRIIVTGGPARMREIALAQNGVLGKIAFLKTFWGIGDKYARNFWMDVCHPEFRDNAAIDVRLENVARAINPDLQAYHEFEGFYQDLADEVSPKHRGQFHLSLCLLRRHIC